MNHTWVIKNHFEIILETDQQTDVDNRDSGSAGTVDRKLTKHVVTALRLAMDV